MDSPAYELDPYGSPVTAAKAKIDMGRSVRGNGHGGVSMSTDYEAAIKYLENLFPKVGKEEICWAYIESEGNIDRAAELILDGQYIAVKLQRAHDAFHRHETNKVSECSLRQLPAETFNLSGRDESAGYDLQEYLTHPPPSNGGSISYHSNQDGLTSVESCAKPGQTNPCYSEERKLNGSQSGASVFYPPSLPGLVSEESDSFLDITSKQSQDGVFEIKNSISASAYSAILTVPASGCNDEETGSTHCRRKGVFDLTIKFTVSHIGPPTLLEEILSRLLFKSGCRQFIRRRVAPVPRAEYEEQACEYWYQAVIIPVLDERQDEMMVQFIQKICYFLGGGFHEQILAEVPGLRMVFAEVRPQHNNVTLTSMAIGNMPNPGMFLVRGDYITNYNEISNSFFLSCVLRYGEATLTKRNDLTSQLKVAGAQPFLSYAHFEHDRRYLTLFFAVRLCEREERMDGLRFAAYKICLPYAALVQVIADMSDASNNTLYLRLKYPPQVWQAVPRSQQCRNKNRRVVNMEQCKEWVRVLKWPGDVRSNGCSSEALADCQYIRVTFPKKNEEGNDQPTYHLLSIISRLMQRSTSKVYFGSVYTTRRELAPETSIRAVGSFRADYAAKALVSRGCAVSDQLLLNNDKVDAESNLVDCHLFFDRVRWCMKECSRACEEALENLLCAIDERRIMDLLRAFHQMYSIRVEAIRRYQRGDVRDVKRTLPRNCVLVRKVMVTPLRTLFMAPEVMMTNRVVRRFGEENALRCVFRDDSGARLIVKDFVQGPCYDQQSSIVANIVQRTLSHGVEINNRHYHFLAWSNSQMRDHGCYMYASTSSHHNGDVAMTVEDMREWMGDFSSSKNVPKLMSRMGQCFTQAQPTVHILQEECCVEDDVEGGSGHSETHELYCFSDGCGRIAPSLARRIALALQLDVVPSCYQVRFKGFKGVLAADPSLDLPKSCPKIAFRKSQMKFKERCEDQENNILEVVKYSMPSAVCLNRPLITILDQVTQKQSRVLHKKLCSRVHYYLEKELSQLGAMLLDDAVAGDELTLRLNLPINFVRLRQCGMCITNEPFFRRVLVSVYRYNINNHLSKAKIFLPHHVGRSMYGVFDETGLLQYGQVFVQYSTSIKKPDGKLKIYTGPVMITKNPCHVAGDVRMFTAVYQPALSHLFDVVVFPRHGPRPHPDEMAGSDLDGDEYSVIFDPDIYFDHNEEAMTFPKSSPDDFDTAPTTDDMVDFFLKYLRQDSIGRMSNAHLILADRRGLFDEICNEIARKCAIAVDFPKSGEPAEPLTIHEQSDVVPDYMFSVVKPMYRSNRLNGQIYRKAKKVEEVLDTSELSTSIFDHDVDKVLSPPGFDPFEGDEAKRFHVRRIRDEYAAKIQQLLDEYGVCDEASIVSGHIVSLKRLATMERDDYSFYHTDKIVELRYTRIYHQYRTYFFEEFGGETVVYQRDPSGRCSLRCDSAMEMKALQWYAVCYAEDPRYRPSSPCMSFPWVVWDVLCSFKRNKMLSQNALTSSAHPLADRFSAEIERHVAKRIDEYELFCVEICEEYEFVRRYNVAYGPRLMYILFVLRRWLGAELFLFCRLTMEHVALLVIKFGLGISKLSSDVRDTCKIRLFPQKLIWGEQLELAFRTYHHIAVTGRFDSIYIGDIIQDVSESESRDPIIVSSSLLRQGYGESPLSAHRILDLLREWTGVSQILTRNMYQNRRNDVILITSVGTTTARQRLARLLLLPIDQLRRAIRDEIMPYSVRDETL
ncbi:RNA-dependent RNA polymerase [Trichostrongylus colubriformis]|uniref:RNA-directed RNA polymerase n=1 Tax=Trichostrongylus colubriformis TaxID=6319 RepID=A0AAN8EW79_TRICO